ncbi:MAG: lysophospholipid acyltransferase family protein [Nitrospirota bacterium]
MNTFVLKTKKQLDRFALVFFARLIKLFAWIVPYGVGIWIGSLFGFVSYYLLPRERKKALAHLTMAFPDWETSWIRTTAQRCFIHLGKSMFEVAMLTPERLDQVVNLPQKDLLQEVHNKGKGIVFVTAHIGNWELLASAVAKIFPVSVIAAPIQPRRMNDMIVRLRLSMGIKTIIRGRSGAAKELIRIFRENRILGILIDQDTDVESAFVDFMGRQAWTPTGAAAMAIKFGAPVIFGYIQRDKKNRHTITMEGPLALIQTGDVEKDIIENTAMLTKKIEIAIRKNPEQWVWMHRRWRRQP